jgi:hypothetical protein
MLCAAACAASQPASRAPSTTPPAPPAAAPAELRMRHPDEVRSSAAPSGQLGVLAPVNAGKPLAEPMPSQPRAASARPLRPIQVAQDSVPRAYLLRDGRLMLPSGLIIHSVPKSVSVRTVREQAGGDVWEIIDARSRRIALLKVEALARAPLPTSERLDELRSVGERSDWGAQRVSVISERFLSERYVYTIERLAKGTAWIASGLELSGHDPR